MKSAIITGSFDPVTKGHAELIKKASSLFDHIYVCVLENAEKRTMFTVKERFEIMKSMVVKLDENGIKNVSADSYSGLTSEYMKINGISYIVKGIRNSTDFDYEYSMAQIMKKFLPGCETIFIPSDPEYLHISSTFVREIIKYGGPLEEAVPEGTADLIREIYSNKICHGHKL